MSRRHAAEKREVLPDPKFHNLVVTKFVNALMYDGKRAVAEAVVYDAIEALAKTSKRDGVEAFLEAITNVKPFIEVKSRRVGGATYQVPIEVRGPRAQQLSIKWIIAAARKRGEKTMMDRLAGELNDALNNRGSAMKKREETHKMAEANKAFAHYRW
jgi:small subunit ribosomal protein S7